MSNNFDVIIIGSGLGGLLCANTLAMEGKKVLVLEKNNQIGGNLQVFMRDGVLFDTGVHYIGGLAEGCNLNKIFKYHGIMNDLEIEPLNQVAFDVISFKNDQNTYAWSQGYEAFEQSLIDQFPAEEKGIKLYTKKIREICDRFPMYNLRNGELDISDDILSLNAKDFIESIVKDEKLQGVLAGNNLLYAGHPSKTPFYVHALVCNSYIESAHKIKGGGGILAQLLAKKIRRLGGKIRRYQEVSQILTEADGVMGVKTTKGDLFLTKTVIANTHPTMAYNLVDKGIRNITKSRLKNTPNTVSSFSVHLVLKPGTVKYLDHNIYHFNQTDVWNNAKYSEENWPKGMMISCPSEKQRSEYAKGLSLLMYMDIEDFKGWEHTQNTVAAKQNRGIGYEDLKKEKADKALEVLYEIMPDVKGNIEQVYTSSPLSYRDYIGTPSGSMYGIQKDCNQPLATMLNTYTRVDGLYLTGQNVSLHGLLGVSMTALKTCGEILGAEYLLEKVNREA